MVCLSWASMGIEWSHTRETTNTIPGTYMCSLNVGGSLTDAFVANNGKPGFNSFKEQQKGLCPIVRPKFMWLHQQFKVNSSRARWLCPLQPPPWHLPLDHFLTEFNPSPCLILQIVLDLRPVFDFTRRRKRCILLYKPYNTGSGCWDSPKSLWIHPPVNGVLLPPITRIGMRRHPIVPRCFPFPSPVTHLRS